MIKVENLTKTFGPKVAVNDVSFTVARGEVLGFLGPNGAGKSTTMRMVTGFLPPTAGRVTIGTHDMLEDPVPAKRLIGYLPESAPCYSDMTVHGFLSFAAEIRGLRGDAIKTAVHRAVEMCFLDSQFLDNHFVTQYTKAQTYFQIYYADFNMQNRVATELEYREITRWRNALMNPTATFKDLLTISCESPTMIVYLDTVSSRGDGGRTPNENFSREIMELFSMGVDNGYDQTDITDMSHAWAGWTVDFVAPTDVFNPLATRLLATGGNTVSNVAGVWGFIFRTNYHGASRNIFTNKFVPARFGAPWTTRTYANGTPGSYQLTFPARTGTNAMQDGYDPTRSGHAPAWRGHRRRPPYSPK